MATLMALFTAAAVIQFVGWILVAIGLSRAQRRGTGAFENSTGISVVVAVRNGAHTLPHLFVALRHQAHKDFELIVVDDNSTDETAEAVRNGAAQDPRIRLVESSGQGKKAALSEGIAAAANDVIALTDADCFPESRWLQTIAHLHDRSEECVVVGYGPYHARPGILNRLVRYETLHTALLTMTGVALGKPYMAVGRNLSYRKSTFERVGGFEHSSDLLSGDDDLFVQSAAAEGVPVSFMMNPGTFVYSEAPHSFREWIRRKRRHLSAGSRYSRVSQLGLLVYHLSAMLCWIAPLVLGWIGLGALLCRLVPGQFVVTVGAASLKEKGLAFAFAGLDLAFQIYLIVVAPVGWLRPPKRW